MGFREVIARNTVFNAAGRAWEALATLLILTPYVVPRIGLPAWGAWALIGAFTGYVALFDVGLSSSYAKYVAQHAAEDRPEAISRVVSTGFFFYLALGAALVAAGWLCIDGLLPAAVRVLGGADLDSALRVYLQSGG